VSVVGFVFACVPGALIVGWVLLPIAFILGIVGIDSGWKGQGHKHRRGHRFDISVKFVGSDNRTYDDRCGVIPAPLDDVGELYKGGVAEGNVCVAIPAGAEGLWTVSTGFDGKPVFFGR
jgi:hypothetical protein